MIFIALALLLIILIFHWRNRNYFKLRKQIWSPVNLPIIGSIYHFLKGSDAEILPMTEKWMIEHGPNILINLFGHNKVILNDPKDVECLLGSYNILSKADEYKFFSDWLGTGLLTSTGMNWRSHRKMLTPSFHYKILDEFVHVFDKHGNVLIKNFEKYAGGDAIDVFTLISLCTLDIICETALGTEIKAQTDTNSTFVQNVRIMCGVIYARVFTPLRFPLIYRFSKTFQMEKRTVKYLREFSDGIIQARKQAIALENKDKLTEQEVDTNKFCLKKKYTFLDCLLRSSIDGKPIPDEDVRDQVDTFVFEGHDTTSIAISFILYCLSKHQDVQEKAYQEIKSVFDEHPLLSITEKLNEMKYLELIIKEGLRLYPPVSVYGRETVDDFQCNNILIPKGTTVGVIPFIYHRNPDIYPDPHKFDPERFSLDNQIKRHPYAYIPFSAGPRNCIGQKFAMLELKCVISKMIRHYWILPASSDFEVQPVIRVTLESMNGIMMKFEKRV